MTDNAVLILNFDRAGSRAITQALRAEQIACRIVESGITLEQVEEAQPRGLILVGDEHGSAPQGLDQRLLSGRWPVLALGSAAILLCRTLGGDAQETVFSGGIGKVSFTPCPLTEGLEPCERMLRNVRRLRLPADTCALAESRGEAVGLMHAALPLYGMQFSLEPNDTDGMRLLLNFALRVCGCTRWWNIDIFIDQAVNELRAQAQGGRAICAVTGGLSSGVTAVLAHRALGGQLQCVFIDTGLLRDGESARVMELYRDQLGLNLMQVQAADRFLSALEGVTDARQKREIISRTLQQVLDETQAQLGQFSLILRSTTASDLMRGEDALKRPGFSQGAPLAEPLRELFKEEVRQAGRQLGLPEAELCRQPFPGSGMALRILGPVTPACLQTLRAADRIFAEEVQEGGLSRRLRRHFAVMSPLPGDDARAVIVLRAVQFVETSQPSYAARLPYDLLERVTQRILRERPEVRRVVYDLTPSTHADGLEWQ